MNKTTSDIISFYESLTPETLAQINIYYANDCYFKDPFNTLTTAQELTSLYVKMFEKLKKPSFKIINFFEKEDQIILIWDFNFNDGFKIHGVSHLILNHRHQIISHIDYWDTVSEIWLKIPLLKSIIRFFYRLV